MTETDENIYVNVDKQGAEMINRPKKVVAIDFEGNETIEVKEL